MIKPAYSVSFVLSINIFVWQNVLYFPNGPRDVSPKGDIVTILNTPKNSNVMFEVPFLKVSGHNVILCASGETFGLIACRTAIYEFIHTTRTKKK